MEVFGRILNPNPQAPKLVLSTYVVPWPPEQNRATAEPGEHLHLQEHVRQFGDSSVLSASCRKSEAGKFAGWVWSRV